MTCLVGASLGEMGKLSLLVQWCIASTGEWQRWFSVIMATQGVITS